MPVSQAVFEETVKKFSEIEDAMDQLWNKSRYLLTKGYEIEAYILILATWNFAGFRYVLKDFDLGKFQATLEKINPIFEKLESRKFEATDFNDENLQRDIREIHSELRELVKQTGATKIMALRNPYLFIMWDTEIRSMYKIDNRGDADDYIKFLARMREEFINIRWKNPEKSLAKAIDEYNYVLADDRRQARKSKK